MSAANDDRVWELEGMLASMVDALNTFRREEGLPEVDDYLAPHKLRDGWKDLAYHLRRKELLAAEAATPTPVADTRESE